MAERKVVLIANDSPAQLVDNHIDPAILPGPSIALHRLFISKIMPPRASLPSCPTELLLEIGSCIYDDNKIRTTELHALCLVNSRFNAIFSPNLYRRSIWGKYPLVRQSATILHHAARHGFIRPVRCIVDSRMQNLNIPDDEGYTPLLRAVSKGYLEIAKILLENGAQIALGRDRQHQTALHYAASGRRGGDMHEMMKLLLKHGGDIHLEARDSNKRTPLHRAVMFNKTGIVQSLLDAGADIEARDVNKRTAVHIAAERHQVQLLVVLKKRGAEMEAVDINEQTPLYLAVTRKKKKSSALRVMKVLMGRGQAEGSEGLGATAAMEYFGKHKQVGGNSDGRWVYYGRNRGGKCDEEVMKLLEELAVIEMAAKDKDEAEDEKVRKEVVKFDISEALEWFLSGTVVTFSLL